jgi:hypothetical protein
MVFLRIRTTFREDLHASLAQLMYSKPLRIPGKLLSTTVKPVDPVNLITKLRQHTAHLTAVLTWG